MPTYKLNHAYEAYRDGVRFGPWAAGDTVNLDVPDAEWVERDSPGALTVKAHEVRTGPSEPVPAAGAQARVGGDPDKAEAAAVAQKLVHAEAAARGKPDDPAVEAEADEDEADEDEADPKRQKRPARDRQHRGGTNRSG